MNFDYTAILLGMFGAAALVLLIDAYLLKPRRLAAGGVEASSAVPVVGYARSFFRVTINGKLAPLRAGGLYSGGFGFSGAPLAIEKFSAGEHVIMFAANRWATDFDGVVPADNLVGHARRIWMNWRFSDWPNWHRIGMRIR